MKKSLSYRNIFDLTTVDEIAEFQKLQDHFPRLFRKFFPDKKAKKTVVIVPSLTLDQHLLSKIPGQSYYEERLLCLLMLLRMPKTHIIYVTSSMVDPIIIDYYLQFLPGITREHAMQRLKLISCYDSSSKSLTEKILERPLIIQRIKESIVPESFAHLTCFNVTEHERKLSLLLNMPIYGCDPVLSELGNKSFSRKIFKECGLPVAFGFENIYSAEQLASAIAEIKRNEPSATKCVVKLNEGFSGEGNAIFDLNGLDISESLVCQIESQLLPRLNPVANDISAEIFMEALERMGGIAERFIIGDNKRSPSVQCRINPLGESKVISTHDQIVGGKDDQVYLGASFPADTAYNKQIGVLGLKVSKYLEDKGVLGRFGVDFMSVETKEGWEHFAIEINLRKGGTTHPYILLQLLTDGDYDYKSGEFYTANGLKRYYICSDNLQDDDFKGLTPPDLMDIAILNNIQYNSTTQEGVMFHLIGALSQYGKVGVVCIGASIDRAKYFYESTYKVLKEEIARLRE